MSSIDGMDEVLDMLDGLKEEILQAALVGVRKGLGRIVAQAKANLGDGVGTGQLRNSITSMAELQGDHIEGQVIAASDHAVYREMGTGPRGEANHAGIAPIPVTYKVDGTTIEYTTKKGKHIRYHIKGWVYKDPKTQSFRYTEGQAAHPYLYPAYKIRKPNLITDVKTAINNRR